MTVSKNKIPPYVSFKTFQTFLEFLSQGMPYRIDRSVWVNRFSGSNGTQLMTAIKFFQLIDTDGIPNHDFDNLVSRDFETQKKTLRNLLFRYYELVFELDLTRATKSQLREKFRTFDTKEGVIVKCESFFIQAARFSNIELSPHILARRHSKNLLGSGEKKKPNNPAVSHVNNFENTINNNIIKVILDKYPDFDPSWAPDVQKSWIESMTKLYDNLK
ncbi:MAG: hypothetical protein CL715_05635 [Chloroflexi bacterium]|nr:hypothetical protein [Chloroflexota bacterium]